MSINLLPWQHSAVDTFVNRCSEQDGILLFHYMGTGKTLTSLAAAVVIGAPIVLVCPPHLTSQWREDYAKKYADVLPPIVFLTYANFASHILGMSTHELEHSTLIMDEAHNLHAVQTAESASRANRVFEKLIKFGKRILLSGTPIYNGVGDLASIVNVVKGSVVLPINIKEFERRYYDTKRMKSFALGYTLPMLKYATKALFTLNMGTLASQLVRGLDNVGMITSETSASLAPIHVFDKIDPVTRLLNKAPWSILEKLKIVESSPTDGTFVHGVSEMGALMYSEHQARGEANRIRQAAAAATVEDMGTLLHPSLTDPSMISNEIKPKVADGVNRLKLSGASAAVSLVCVAIEMIYRPKLEKMKHVKTKRIAKTIRDAIDWFALPKDSSNFPKVKDKVVSVAFTEEQNGIFMRYALSSLTREDLQSMGLVYEPEHALSFVLDQKHTDDFLDYGRLIGSSVKGKLRSKFDPELQCFVLKGKRRGTDMFRTCSKFQRVRKVIQTKSERTVIYSNFSSVLRALSTFLSASEIPHKVLVNEMSEKLIVSAKRWLSETPGGTLLLDSDYSEGISFMNVSRMIIMEPALNNSTMDQIKARIVRVKSHKPGSTVTILTLVSKVPAMSLQPLKTWLYEAPQMFYTTANTTFERSSTPDQLVDDRNKLLNGISHDIIKYVRKAGKARFEKCVPRKPPCPIASDFKNLKPCDADAEKRVKPYKKKKKTGKI